MIKKRLFRYFCLFLGISALLLPAFYLKAMEGSEDALSCATATLKDGYVVHLSPKTLQGSSKLKKDIYGSGKLYLLDGSTPWTKWDPITARAAFELVEFASKLTGSVKQKLERLIEEFHKKICDYQIISERLHAYLNELGLKLWLSVHFKKEIFIKNPWASHLQGIFTSWRQSVEEKFASLCRMIEIRFSKNNLADAEPREVGPKSSRLSLWFSGVMSRLKKRHIFTKTYHF